MPPLARRVALVCFATVVSLLLLLHLHGINGAGRMLGLQHARPLSWSEVTLLHPLQPSLIHELPTGEPIDIPHIQHQFAPETEGARQIRLNRRDAVKEELLHSWKGYRRYAWMHDEVTPLTRSFRDPFGSWGATLVDSLDTLLIMGFNREFDAALTALEQIDFTRPDPGFLNIFETTIRYLGGLLSANDLTNGRHTILKKKALEIGNMLYHAFDTPNRMPMTRWNWDYTLAGVQQEASSYALTAELGSLTLEFTRLSQISGDPKFFDAVQRITDTFEKGQNITYVPGLWPVTINAATLSFTGRSFTFGAMSDSLYEYLTKQYLLLGGTNPQYRSMYATAIERAKEHLFFRPYQPRNLDILISGTVRPDGNAGIILVPEGQHLACFAGGMIALGAKVFSRPDEIDIARRLVHGCIWAANSTTSGIMPESFHAAPCEDPATCDWDVHKWYDGVNVQHQQYEGPEPADLDDRAKRLIKAHQLPEGFTSISDRRYLLRPEVVESLFVMYRITGDTYYQDAAWLMFNSIKKACRTGISYAGIANVMANEQEREQIDSSESFWMAETLKYFYLIFSEPELISLDDYVLNTEAHPLLRPRRSPD